MLRTLIILCLTWGMFFNPCGGSELFPSLDVQIPMPLTKAFRVPTQDFVYFSEKLPSREGLELLRASASGQFDEGNLTLMLLKLPYKKIIVVDLREESHGFVNGLPISWKFPHSTWTNVSKSLASIEADEKQRLKNILSQKDLTLDPYHSPLKLHPFSTCTEQELLSRHGVKYIRLPVTENHRPSDATVEQIVQLVRTLPADSWMHIHCHGGRGRTTTFLIMYDIILNSRKVSFDDIILRQHLLGGTDLTKKLDHKNPRHAPQIQRMAFLKQFYAYSKTSDINKVSWTSWSKEHSKLPKAL